MARQQRRDQDAEIHAARAQRGQLDVQAADARQQVGAKAPARDQRVEVGVRRAHQAEIDAHRLAARRAQRHDLALLHGAQQLDLRRGGQLADLVEQQRAAGGRRDHARAILRRAREGAAPIAEELALDQVLGQRAAVDRDERARAPRQRVQRARRDLLADAGLAAQQDRAPGCVAARASMSWTRAVSGDSVRSSGAPATSNAGRGREARDAPPEQQHGAARRRSSVRRRPRRRGSARRPENDPFSEPRSSKRSSSPCCSTTACRSETRASGRRSQTSPSPGRGSTASAGPRAMTTT